MNCHDTFDQIGPKDKADDLVDNCQVLLKLNNNCARASGIATLELHLFRRPSGPSRSQVLLPAETLYGNGACESPSRKTRLSFRHILKQARCDARRLVQVASQTLHPSGWPDHREARQHPRWDFAMLSTRIACALPCTKPSWLLSPENDIAGRSTLSYWGIDPTHETHWALCE
jgi:hypothetical protein